MTQLHSVRGTSTGYERAIGFGSLLLFGLLSGVAILTGVTWKLPAISWVAFGAMAIGALLGGRTVRSTPLGAIWGYGLASGAMITSAALFLIPQALASHEAFGGLGIAGGFLAGYVGHLLGQRLTHPDLPVEHTTAELTGHALAAGAIIGAIYTSMPSLTSVLGVAIVSHKAPAGYAAARRLADRGESGIVLLLPAAAVGLIALPVGIIGLSPPPAVQGLLFGVAAGLFLHVAVDLLPSCTGTGELCAVDASPESHNHHFQEPHRSHAAMSSLAGGAAVVVVWLLVI